MSKRPVAEVLDRSGGAEAVGTLIVAAQNVRRPNRTGTARTFKAPRSTAVSPLLAVDGRPVRLGRGTQVHLRLAAGTHLVEVMDDHHYESRTVDVDEDVTATLWLGVGLLRSEPRIHLGSREYAAKSVKVDRLAEQIAAVVAVVAFFAGLAYVPAWLQAVDAVPDMLALPVLIGFAAAVFWAIRALARRLLRRRGQADIGAPDPEPVSHSLDPAHEAMLVPRGAVLPEAEAAVCLHFRAEPKALAAIRIRDRLGTTDRKRRMPYFSNSRVDWLAAPEVTVNGEPFEARWGTWWVPVRPGQVRLRVRLPGFVNGEFRGPSGTAELETTVAAGRVRHVECRYNIVELATARLTERPDAEAEWQRELRARDQLARAVRRARAPRLALRAGRSESITAGSRLAR